MGLFDLFRKRAHSKAVQRHIGEANAMSAALLSASGVEFDSASKLEQALIGTFYFGMLTAHGMLHALSPREVHELALASFELGLHYTPAAAMEATEECIAAATPG
ncbi:MAG TPA: Imm48 family immunity protein, partial [Gammaproteobacteria bacterium]